MFPFSEVNACVDLCREMVQSHDGRQHALDPAEQHLLKFAAVLELVRGQRHLVGLFSTGHQAPVLIDHRDFLGLEFWNAGRHQVDDGSGLFRSQTPPRLNFDQHRCPRFACIAHKHRGTRQRQVNPCTLHRIHAGNRAGELAFQTTLVAGRLNELAAAETGLAVEQLVPWGRVLQKPGIGQLQLDSLEFR